MATRSWYNAPAWASGGGDTAAGAENPGVAGSVVCFMNDPG